MSIQCPHQNKETKQNVFKEGTDLKSGSVNVNPNTTKAYNAFRESFIPDTNSVRLQNNLMTHQQLRYYYNLFQSKAIGRGTSDFAQRTMGL